MKPNEAYGLWAEIYDSNENSTRDLEAVSLRNTLDQFRFENCLEIGCGTGKNTAFLTEIAKRVIAADLTEQMLQKAREKNISRNAEFMLFDARGEWIFKGPKFDLITFSLVLEHIEDLDAVFAKAATFIAPGGYVYVGELHPFKQYTGTKARFESREGTRIVECYDHNISDFTSAASSNNFDIVMINEYFDEANRRGIPRILTILFKNSSGT